MNNAITTGPRRRRRTWTIVALLLTALMLLAAACGGDDNGAAEDISGTAECDAEPVILTTDDGVDFVRTPDSCFDDLPDFPYEPQYAEIDGLRQAYVDEGPAEGEVVLLLHGQPSWSYLYRDMIPVLAGAGYRVIAMDHLGTGRSDKPIDIEDYSYVGHADRLERFIEELGLTDINMFVQDWGSLIGLKVAGENPDLFATIAVGDGALLPVPEGTGLFPPVENPNEITDIQSPFAAMPAQQVPFYEGCDPILGPDDGYFGNWMAYAMTAESFHPSEVVEAMTWYDLTTAEEAAYDAPFPSRTYMAGIRVFPSLANQLGGNTIEAWNGLTSFEKPFLTLWASNDPGNLGSCETQQQLVDNVPGAAGQPHDRLPEASHFLQDDQGTEIATRLVNWYDNLDEEPAGATQGEERVGYELLQIQDDGTIWAWIAYDMTQEQFDALDLPSGWLRNQPREGVPDSSQFNGSPGNDGVLLEEEHFGFDWFHSATITSVARETLDDEGLIRASTVEKDHEVSFDPGSTLSLLVAPSGEIYVMVSRDAGRTTDDPTLPAGWEIVEHVVADGFTALLSGETTVIRMDNEDSYQGPVTGIELRASSAAGPSFGVVNTTLMADLAASGDDSPFFMVNLIAFRDEAVYADGRPTDLSGREANDLYATTGVTVLLENGMRPAIAGEVTAATDQPPDPAWDQVSIARYPSYSAFVAMTADPAFQEGVEHKDAGVEATTVIVTHRLDDPPSAEDLPAAEDPVALLEIISHAGSGTSDRPAALSEYLEGLNQLVADHGGIALGTYEVTGVLIGDGREWDEARIWWFADRSDLDAFLADPELMGLTAARELALDDYYPLVLDGVQVEPLGRTP